MTTQVLILVSILTATLTCCQATHYTPTPMNIACGRDLLPTDDLGVYRCSLGHTESMYIAEGFDYRPTCRVMISPNTTGSRSSTLQAVNRPQSNTRLQDRMKLEAAGVEEIDHTKDVYYRPCGLKLNLDQTTGLFNCDKGHTEDIAVNDGVETSFFCREMTPSNIAPLELEQQTTQEGGIDWKKLLTATTIVGIAAIALAVSGGTRFPTSTAVNPVKLMIFGGQGHDTYLGCLSCQETETDSIFNKFGYGSPYKTDSLRNRYGPYGSRYSPYSACSRYASDPPVIVDRDGNFYGRLTINSSHPQASRDAVTRELVEKIICN